MDLWVLGPSGFHTETLSQYIYIYILLSLKCSIILLFLLVTFILINVINLINLCHFFHLYSERLSLYSNLFVTFPMFDDDVYNSRSGLGCFRRRSAVFSHVPCYSLLLTAGLKPARVKVHKLKPPKQGAEYVFIFWVSLFMTFGIEVETELHNPGYSSP